MATTAAGLSPIVVTDSSVLIKWFCEEEDTDKALKLRERQTQGDTKIVIPDLSLYEVANALRHNKSMGEKDVQDALQSIFNLELDIVVPTKDVLDLAVSLAFQHNITTYDAYFVALAQALQFVFITADQGLYNKIKSLPDVIFLKDLVVEENGH